MSVPRISKEELKQRLDSGQGLVVVDARLKYPYEHSTVKLPGAIRFTAGAPRPSLPRDRDIVVYDSDPNELASSRVAAELIREGYRAAALARRVRNAGVGKNCSKIRGGVANAAPAGSFEPGTHTLAQMTKL